MDSVIQVSFDIQICGVPVKINSRLDVSGVDPIVLDCYFAANGAPIVCLPDAAKAAVLRHAVVEAKDREPGNFFQTREGGQSNSRDSFQPGPPLGSHRRRDPGHPGDHRVPSGTNLGSI